ncbi:isopeptide-forming domain-containing fimbrial protein [Companilactobacillus baiquanensis]|uniref:Isopeptide-forming domain-containing fimbrial protein n=1 Tax=Companilactobacillus baiquanensis TaxID=2486005 RepID=A0ABW1UR38_9LACO|nr:isopeptide-forming domain-containing fimbrial protein [Companilactobacillus baiquanensis]
MRLIKAIFKIFLALFINISIILISNQFNTIVNAAMTSITNSAVFDSANRMAKFDGIDNWDLQPGQPPNEIGRIPIGGNVSLGYTFGAARDATGKVVGGDTTITQESTVTNAVLGPNSSAPSITNSKVNIFLDINGQYYGILHQGKNSYIGDGGTPQTASDTSIDFALPTGNLDSEFYSSSNILAKLVPISSTYNGCTKLFFKGSDANGRPAYKLAGYYAKSSIYVEIVLKADPSGAPIVRRELYIYNANSAKKFQVFYGEDTGLDPNNDSSQAVDNVPMYSMGNKQGLYLLSGVDENGDKYDPASKLFISNDVNNGFKDFMGRVLTNPGNWGVKGKTGSGNAPSISSPTLPWASNPTSTQNGDTDTALDTNLLRTTLAGQEYDVVDGDGKQDSAYTLRWPEVSIKAGEIKGFSAKIGATIKGISIPSMKMTYKNLNRSDGTNQVNDKLEFTIKVPNDGYDSTWIINHLLDVLPQGLTLDPSTVGIKDNSIDYDPNLAIKDGTTGVLTFEATINNTAPYNLDSSGNLINKASVTGNNSGKDDSITLTDSVKIPVETPSFKYRFTEQLRNNTDDPNGTFTNRVDAKAGDIIDYKVNFVSNGSSTVTNTSFYNTLGTDGLEVVPNSVTWNGGPGDDGLYFPLGNLTNGVTYTISFQAKVKKDTPESSISNKSTLIYFLDGGNLNYRTDTEEPAIVDVKNPRTTSFKEVPSQIKFGTVHSLNTDRLLKNISTIGKLRVSHTSDTPFQVNVSYDGSGDNSLSSNGNKLVQDDGHTLLINQAQTDGNTWQPLSTAPIPINSDGFAGSYDDLDLTNYVDTNKWQLRVPGNSQAGEYNGIITWSIADTL